MARFYISVAHSIFMMTPYVRLMTLVLIIAACGIPQTGAVQRIPSPFPLYDLFCCGHAFLADGRLLVAGGASGYPPERRGPSCCPLPRQPQDGDIRLAPPNRHQSLVLHARPADLSSDTFDPAYQTQIERRDRAGAGIPRSLHWAIETSSCLQVTRRRPTVATAIIQLKSSGPGTPPSGDLVSVGDEPESS